jgi:anti-anti-sigma factor
MSVKADEYDKICVIEVNGDLSGDNARLAAAALEERAAQEKRVVDFVVDLGMCPFIDSEGLETLLGMKRRCEDLFGQIRLARVDENCQMILRITRLEHRFQMHDDLAQALKTMR